MEGEVLHGIDELVGEDTRGTEREEADVQLLVVEGHKAGHPKFARRDHRPEKLTARRS